MGSSDEICDPAAQLKNNMDIEHYEITKRLLRKNYMKIKEQWDSNEIRGKLYAKGIISGSENEIMLELLGNQKRTEKLITVMLEKKSKHQFIEFIKLFKADREDLYEYYLTNNTAHVTNFEQEIHWKKIIQSKIVYLQEELDADRILPKCFQKSIISMDELAVINEKQGNSKKMFQFLQNLLQKGPQQYSKLREILLD